MSNAAFLLLALGLSVAGSVLIWLLNRKPKTFMSSIDDFSREMKALGREPDGGPTVRRRRRPVTPPPLPRVGENRSPDATEERRP